MLLLLTPFSNTSLLKYLYVLSNDVYKNTENTINTNSIKNIGEYKLIPIAAITKSNNIRIYVDFD